MILTQINVVRMNLWDHQFPKNEPKKVPKFRHAFKKVYKNSSNVTKNGPANGSNFWPQGRTQFWHSSVCHLFKKIILNLLKPTPNIWNKGLPSGKAHGKVKDFLPACSELSSSWNYRANGLKFSKFRSACNYRTFGLCTDLFYDQFFKKSISFQHTISFFHCFSTVRISESSEWSHLPHFNLPIN